VIFQSPTVEGLAKRMTAGNVQPSFYSLVPIQVNGSRPPLFAVHTITLQDLVNHLGDEQPVYFIRYAMASANSNKPVRLPSLVDLASHYIKEMKLVMPSGPYYLIGFSFGGIIAYEMAYQLDKLGEKVNLVGLIDTYITRDRKLLPIHHIIYNIIKHMKNKILAFFKNKNTTKPPKNNSDEFWPTIYTSAPDQTCRKNYEPNIYNGRITLFQGSKYNSTCFHYKQPMHGWKKFLGDRIDVQTMSGSHFEILKEPHAKILAEKIVSCMDKANETLM